MRRLARKSILTASVILLMLLTFGSTLLPWSTVLPQDHGMSAAKTFTGNEVIPAAPACIMAAGVALLAYAYTVGLARKLAAIVLLLAGLSTTVAIIVALMECSAISVQLFRREFHLLAPAVAVKNMAYSWVSFALSILLNSAIAAMVWSPSAANPALQGFPSNSNASFGKKNASGQHTAASEAAPPGSTSEAAGKNGNFNAVETWDALSIGKDPTALP